MSNIVRQTIQSTSPIQAGYVPVALSAGLKREVYDDLAMAAESLLRSCFVEIGNETRSAPIGLTADFWVEFGASPELPRECIRMIMKLMDVYLRCLAEPKAEEELAALRPSLHEEIEVLVESLAHIPGVEELKVQEEKWGFGIWVIVNNAPEESRYAIYDVEWEVMRQFPGCLFDFHLIDRRGMDLSSLVTFADETLTVPVRTHDYA